MKKVQVFLIAIVLSVLSLQGKTIRVGPSESVTHIKQAITMAQPGDTILVRAGIYREGNIILQN